MNHAAKKQVIEDPGFRGGASTEIVERTGKRERGARAQNGGYFAKVLRGLKDDQNLLYLAARLQNYSELTEARMGSLRQAIEQDDGEAVADIAHALSDSTAKIGAIRMMKLCIALQMLGRRGLVQKARELLAELEAEYERFKENLIYAVG